MEGQLGLTPASGWNPGGNASRLAPAPVQIGDSSASLQLGLTYGDFAPAAFGYSIEGLH